MAQVRPVLDPRRFLRQLAERAGALRAPAPERALGVASRRRRVANQQTLQQRIVVVPVAVQTLQERLEAVCHDFGVSQSISIAGPTSRQGSRSAASWTRPGAALPPAGDRHRGSRNRASQDTRLVTAGHTSRGRSAAAASAPTAPAATTTAAAHWHCSGDPHPGGGSLVSGSAECLGDRRKGGPGRVVANGRRTHGHRIDAQARDGAERHAHGGDATAAAHARNGHRNLSHAILRRTRRA